MIHYPTGMMVKLTIIVCLCLFIFSMSACTLSQWGGAAPTIKIGLVAPFEGLYRAHGYEALFAVKLAIQERNQGEGLNGYRVELVALNDFADPADAVMQAQALVADPDVLGVVGHLSAASTEAALPIYEQANLAVSVPWSVEASAEQTAGVVYLAADRTQTDEALTQFVQTRGFSQIQIMTSPAFDIGPQSEALIISGDGVAGGEAILQLKEQGVKLPLFAQSEVGSPHLGQVAGEAGDGLIFVSPGPNGSDIPEGEAFVATYQALAGFQPGPRAVLAYDATQVLLDALEQTIQADPSEPDRAAVQLSITQVQRAGLTGELVFTPQGQRVIPMIWFYQIAEGQYPGVQVVGK